MVGPSGADIPHSQPHLENSVTSGLYKNIVASDFGEEGMKEEGRKEKERERGRGVNKGKQMRGRKRRNDG